MCLGLCPATVASRPGLLEGDARSCPKKIEHLSTYGFRTIPIMVCDAALPAEMFSCSAGAFFSKMVSEDNGAALSDICPGNSQG